MREHLRSLLQQRYDGAWELLATPAGNPNAVARTCEMLSCAVLDDFTHPDWLIAERVEALSAFDPSRLSSLAKTWPKPVETASPLVRWAWRAALRHLLPFSHLARKDFTVPELAEEVSIVWEEDPAPPITWDYAFHLVEQEPIFNFALIRRLARRGLADPLPSLDKLLLSPPWMLRLLRGHVHRLDASTKSFVIKSAQRCLASDLRSGAYVAQEVTVDRTSGGSTITKSVNYIPLGEIDLSGNATEAAPILELCREFGTELVDDLANLLAAQIVRLTDPRLAAPLAYLLLTPWNLP